MKNLAKVFLFFSGLALSIAGAAAILYKFFKKHCVIHIEFNPAEENSRPCECDEDTCELCNPSEDCEECVDDEIEIELIEEEDK
ncbi:MAG: hypothetical protein IKA43_04985 [Clostridia bacterium]|nr:hypothetical protein [Clostridia bacterium]